MWIRTRPMKAWSPSAWRAPEQAAGRGIPGDRSLCNPAAQTALIGMVRKGPALGAIPRAIRFRSGSGQQARCLSDASSHAVPSGRRIAAGRLAGAIRRTRESGWLRPADRRRCFLSVERDYGLWHARAAIRPPDAHRHLHTQSRAIAVADPLAGFIPMALPSPTATGRRIFGSMASLLWSPALYGDA